MTITIRVLNDGHPVRRTLVRHRSGRPGAALGWSISDDDGEVRLPGRRGPVLLQVMARNSVVRVAPSRWEPVTTAPLVVADGTSVDLAGQPGAAAIALASACVTAYDRGLRGFAPFADCADPAWPLSAVRPGRGLRTPVIEVLHPDRTPAHLPFVEPASPRSGGPRIRLQRGNLDAAGRPLDIAVLAHELAHALHFSLMRGRTRLAVEARYAAWLAATVATGREPTHSAMKRTSGFVAWLEAFGLFAERYDRFQSASDRHESDRPTRNAAFLAAEAERWGALPADWDPAVEGWVYAAVIVRRGLATSLDRAVAEYLGGAQFGVLGLRDHEAVLASRPIGG